MTVDLAFALQCGGAYRANPALLPLLKAFYAPSSRVTLFHVLFAETVVPLRLAVSQSIFIALDPSIVDAIGAAPKASFFVDVEGAGVIARVHGLSSSFHDKQATATLQPLNQG